jgi:hypothetical protein
MWLKGIITDFLADTEKISGLNSIYFHAKTILSGDYFLFSVFWFVKRHSFKPHALHFLLNYECDVIFVVPQRTGLFFSLPSLAKLFICAKI